VKRNKTNTGEQVTPAKLKRLNRLVDTVCGIYSRVAQRLGVHRSYVSRVAKGERRSEPVERALVEEYKRVNEH
jgi:transcriptional regulator with XRE-family HTH domain